MNTRTLGTGTWISVGAPVITEAVAGMGFDWLLIDLEHGSMTEADLLPNLHAAAASGVKVIVRIGEFRPSLVGRVLDFGAAGIMVPHVSDAATAARIVSAMRYPPHGERGFSTSTRSFGYGARAPKEMSGWEAPLLLAQIEDYEGVLEAERIAAVDGVDMLFVGRAIWGSISPCVPLSGRSISTRRCNVSQRLHTPAANRPASLSETRPTSPNFAGTALPLWLPVPIWASCARVTNN